MGPCARAAPLPHRGCRLKARRGGPRRNIRASRPPVGRDLSARSLVCTGPPARSGPACSSTTTERPCGGCRCVATQNPYGATPTFACMRCRRLPRARDSRTSSSWGRLDRQMTPSWFSIGFAGTGRSKRWTSLGTTTLSARRRSSGLPRILWGPFASTGSARVTRSMKPPADSING